MEPKLSRLDASRALQQEGRFHAAADLLLEAFREDPENAAVTRQLGFVLGAMGDSEGAVQFLRRSHFCDPADPETLAGLILHLRELDRTEEAAHALLESIGAELDQGSFVGHLLESRQDHAA